MMQKAGENINIQSASQKIEKQHKASGFLRTLCADRNFRNIYGSIAGIFDRIYPHQWNSESDTKIICLALYDRKCVNAAGTDQHDMDDDTCPRDRDSIWNRRGYLHGRIREKRQ